MIKFLRLVFVAGIEIYALFTGHLFAGTIAWIACLYYLSDMPEDNE